MVCGFNSMGVFYIFQHSQKASAFFVTDNSSVEEFVNST